MEKEIKIKDFIVALKKRLWLIVTIAVLMSLLSGFYNIYTTTPLYQSSTRIFLPLNKADFVTTLAVMIKDRSVLEKVIERLDLNRSADALSRRIDLSSENGSEIVKITFTDSNPESAANIVNAATAAFLQEIGNVFGIYQYKILSEAKPGYSPINIKPRRNFDVGFAIGLVLGIGIALLLDSLDDHIRSEREVERLLQLPVLGSVSKMNRINTRRGKVKQNATVIKGGIMGVKTNA